MTWLHAFLSTCDICFLQSYKQIRHWQTTLHFICIYIWEYTTFVWNGLPPYFLKSRCRDIGYCRGVCRISERFKKSKPESRSFEARDQIYVCLMKRFWVNNPSVCSHTKGNLSCMQCYWFMWVHNNTLNSSWPSDAIWWQQHIVLNPYTFHYERIPPNFRC